MPYWETQPRADDQSNEDFCREGYRSTEALIGNFVYRASIINDALEGIRPELADKYDRHEQSWDQRFYDPTGWVLANEKEAAALMQRNREQYISWDRDQRVPAAEHINGSEYWRELPD